MNIIYKVIDFLYRVYEFVIEEMVLFDVYNYLIFKIFSFSFFIYFMDKVIVVREWMLSFEWNIDVLF